MAGNITLTMIKPTAVKEGHMGEIITMIEAKGFQVIACKMMRLSKRRAKQFYAVHEGKPFFDRLVKFMTSGPVIPMVLEKDNAVEDYRKLIGSTDPEKAEEGTIRKKFATSLTENAVHGSDSDQNAAIEAAFFFSELERFSFTEG